MYKNMLRRSWLSVMRKPSRSVILILILFVMANMLLATVAIKNSVDKSMSFAKEKLGAIVYLQPDTDALRAAAEKSTSKNSDDSSSRTPVQFTMPTISEKLASSIAKSKYIKDYTYSAVASANADGFTAVETAQNEREREFQNSLNDAKNQFQNQVNDFNTQRDQFNQEQQNSNQSSSNSGRRFGGESGGMARPNFSFNFNTNFADPSLSRGDMTIQGINSFDFVSDVESGNMKITSGKAFDESTKNSVVISSELADSAKLAVGDKIKFKTVTDKKEISFTIVGIYQTSTEDFNYNTVYTNIDGAKKFMTDDEIKNLSLQNVHYYLNSASDKDAFLAATAKEFPEIAKSNLKLDIDDSAYQTMVGPIESVGSFAVTILWIVIIAAVAIITLMVVINVKDRRYEMGVLMSIGAKRLSILGQILIELVVVGTVAFALSLGTGQLLAQKMGDGLLSEQISQSNQKSDSDSSSDTPGGRGLNAMRRFTPGGESQTTVKQISTIDVSAGVPEYSAIFGIGYLILLIAMVAPSVNILRYQPKTILTGKE